MQRRRRGLGRTTGHQAGSVNQPARIATFTALAAFAAHHWFALTSQPPIGRLVGVCALVAILALGLTALKGVDGRPGRWAAAAGLSAAAAVVGLVVTGLPLRFLPPGAWPELSAALSGGLAGVSQVELPYAGPDEWTRTGVLLAAPLVATLCTALAFWPSARAQETRRIAAMAGLVALYAFAVTWEAPSAELARGLALLVLVAAFLWLPRLPARRSAAAAAALASAGVLALPLAAQVSADDPIIDYRGWTLFGAQREVSFDWNHSYGPFDWPQKGTTLLEIRSDRPLLWKTTVLDLFDGSRWLRGPAPGAPEVPSDLAGASDELVAANRERGWSVFPGIEVRALTSGLLVGAGTTIEVNGVATDPIAADGTAVLADATLSEGDSYSVNAYSPDPSRRQLRRAGERYPAALARYTALTLPSGRDGFGAAAPVYPLNPVIAPLRGSRGDVRPHPVRETVEGTAYERVYSLTRELTRDAPTPYAAVSAVERHLRTNYRYEQRVPLRRQPLPAFLFMDREGYCQQFSGAMALMLRMAGIPSRVAAGFSPGYRAPGDNVYSVRDTDAHSWVEVWFRGIGWVAFDPTPGAAPAQAQSLAAFRGQGSVGEFGAGRALSIEEAAEAGPGGARVRAPADDDGPSPAGITLGLLGLLAVGGAVAADLRRRRLIRPEGAALQLRELRHALPRLGYDMPPGATLLGLEQRLEPVAARYVARLRANRFAAGRPRRPGSEERRAMRRALVRGSTLRALPARWRAFRAIPPGGPR